MKNVPEVKLGIVAVSRGSFPIALSTSRRGAVVAAVKKCGVKIIEISTAVENENDTMRALAELRDSGCNTLVVYLGNFGPEGPETLLAQKFDGPVMFVAAGEETGADIMDGRGDAYCGMLNASYNLALRGVKAFIPEHPVGTPDEVAIAIREFFHVAKIYLGVKGLKIFAFGPRPSDFFACNAPIKPLFDLGVEVQENSQLDLWASFNAHADDKRIDEVVKDMTSELGEGNKHPGILPKLAQLELTLHDWAEKNIGASKYFAFANKCWPTFQAHFGMVPCYVNSRLAGRGIPVACEADIYGALSEYMLTCATDLPPTLLNINNTVPHDLYLANHSKFNGYSTTDVFMGSHCGNTPICHLKNPEMKHQFMMKRLLEPDGEPCITRGTLEGTLKSGDITLFRLQSTASTQLRSYIAQGETIDVDPATFGGVGIIAINEMGRFYRHVLIEKNYPHNTGMGYGHVGKYLFGALGLLGITEIDYNKPAGRMYNSENPFQ